MWFLSTNFYGYYSEQAVITAPVVLHQRSVDGMFNQDAVTLFHGFSLISLLASSSESVVKNKITNQQFRQIPASAAGEDKYQE